jgi:hypothetical protein
MILDKPLESIVIEVPFPVTPGECGQRFRIGHAGGHQGRHFVGPTPHRFAGGFFDVELRQLAGIGSPLIKAESEWSV